MFGLKVLQSYCKSLGTRTFTPTRPRDMPYSRDSQGTAPFQALLSLRPQPRAFLFCSPAAHEPSDCSTRRSQMYVYMCIHDDFDRCNQPCISARYIPPARDAPTDGGICILWAREPVECTTHRSAVRAHNRDAVCNDVVDRCGQTLAVAVGKTVPAG